METETYIITEKQGENAAREGYTINVQSLPAAKRVASRRQFFQGTVLTIESEAGTLLASKSGGKWSDGR